MRKLLLTLLCPGMTLLFKPGHQQNEANLFVTGVYDANH